MHTLYKQHGHYFLLVALLITAVLVFYIIQPFLAPLILAAVFAFLFQPIYQRFLRYTRGSSTISGLLTTLAAILLVLVPAGLIGTLIFKESTDLYAALAADNDVFTQTINRITSELHAVLPIPADFEFNIGQYIRQGASILASNLGTIFSSVAQTFLNTFVFLMAFYFFLKDGYRLKDYVVNMSPLDDENDNFIVSRVESAVSSTVKGNLMIGLIQGTLSGIGFALFGVPNPVLWGSVTAISALIPGIGTSLVLLPAILYLFFTGNIFGGVGLTLWGITAVGLVDNLLGPRLVGRGMKLHPLAVFLAVLGGLTFFGPLGFLLGPLTMSVCMALLDIYASLKAKEFQGEG